MFLNHNSRIQTSAEVANLLALIERARDALEPCSAQHPDRISLCVDLALHLWKLYKLTGSPSAREEILQVSYELVALRYSTHCHQDWAICCAILVDFLQERSEQTGDLTLLDQVVELHHEIWVSWPADSPCRAEVLAQAMRFLYGRYTQTGSVPLLVQAIEIQRQILQLHPTGHLDREESCTTLAQLLHERYDQTGDATLLNEMTELLQEALSLCPANHPGRSIFCSNLVVALNMSYEENGDIALLDEAIKLGSEVIVLRPIGHPERSTSCGSLATSLLRRYMHAGDPALLEKAMELQREAVDLCPKGHPEQVKLLEHLAVIYQKCYNQSGSTAMLEAAVRIQRDCLDMCAVGDPRRWIACGNLALSLRWQYDQTGDVTLLDEAIALIRETLSLLGPARDVRRAVTYGNLATSLRLRYNRTGDIGLLNEVTKLQREALSLCPARHPERARACENLAGSLSTRYSQTHDITVLTEAISLEREALALCPAGHPNRAGACSDLAYSLDYLYTRTKDGAALAEAITLQREALGLYPAGHYEGALARQSLAKALRLRHYDTGDVTLLDEVIELLREALDLCPAVHPLRAVMCGSLAEALTTQYNLTNDVAIFDEIYKLQREALEHSLPQDAWRPLAVLSGIHLVVGTPYFSLPDAFRCIQQSCETRTVDELQGFMIQVCPRIRLLWNFQNKWTPDITSSLVDVYAAIIDQVPMMAGFVLDTPSRLLVLKTTSEIGSDACVAAILAGQFARAIEILDHAHGIFWSQSLHPRDPQLKGAPPEIASELGSLLRAMAVPVPDLEKASRSPKSHLTAYDVRHQQNSQIQAILNQIRASPGSERFMLGSTFEELRESARHHPVVMLVNRWGHVFALIMSSSSEKSPGVLRLRIKWDDLLLFAKAAGQVNVWYRTGSGDVTDSERVMRPGQHPSRQQPLEMLWTAVVKPVLSRLGLVVSHTTRASSPQLTNILVGSKCPGSPAATSLVHYRRLGFGSNSRRRNLRRLQQGVLLRLRRLLVHPHAERPPPRTPGSAAGPDRRCKAPASCRFAHRRLASACPLERPEGDASYQ
jgi:tetratricopeptide (TPR) repeat protein